MRELVGRHRPGRDRAEPGGGALLDVGGGQQPVPAHHRDPPSGASSSSVIAASTAVSPLPTSRPRRRERARSAVRGPTGRAGASRPRGAVRRDRQRAVAGRRGQDHRAGAGDRPPCGCSLKPPSTGRRRAPARRGTKAGRRAAARVSRR